MLSEEEEEEDSEEKEARSIMMELTGIQLNRMPPAVKLLFFGDR